MDTMNFAQRHKFRFHKFELEIFITIINNIENSDKNPNMLSKILHLHVGRSSF